MNRRFSELASQVLNAFWEENPVEATFAGVHAYDGVLPRTDAVSRAAYSRQRIASLESLKKFEARSDELDEGARLDLAVLKAELEAQQLADERFRHHERRADLYPAEAMYGIYLLLMRNFAPAEQRLESVRDRLLDTPRFLAEGRENLRSGADIPGVWTQTGIQVARAGAGFYSQISGMQRAESASLQKELDRAAGGAAEALEEFTRFLENELAQREDGPFAVGRQSFDFLLRRKHMVPYDAESLRRFGRELIGSTREQLAELGDRISPGKPWHEIVEELKNDHPPAGEVVRAYEEQMVAARRFVLERNLVTLPEGETLRVVPTPQFERATIPYAAYVPPAPFEELKEGIFWVTPPEGDGQQLADQLRGHCSWGIPVTALHEAYPGHHLQLSVAADLDSDVRRQFWTTVFVEGWALYCEQMMEDVGFISDPRSRLLRLKDQLWRACRVVIDASLHCFGMSFDEAVRMLVDVAKLEPANAAAEVRRYTQTPTQPMSYLVGKHQILALREELGVRQGELEPLKRFHDALLSYGSIPLELIRPLLLSRQS